MKKKSPASGPISTSGFSLPAVDDDKLSPSRQFLACSSNSETSDEPQVCDSLAAAKEAIYPAAAVCVILLTTLAICYSLYFTKAVMLPILGAFLLNFLFSPVVLKLNRIGIPNVVGTLLVLGLAVSAILIALAFAYQPTSNWLADREANLAIVKQKLNALQKPMKTIKDVSEQIDELSSGQSKEDSEASTDAIPIEGKNESEDATGKSASDPSAEGGGMNAAGSDFDSLRSSEVAGGESRQNRPTLSPVQGTSVARNPPISKQKSSSLSKANETENKEKATTDSKVVESPIPSTVIPVEVQQPSISNRIFSTTGDAFAGISLMLVLLFYLLSAGDRGLEKLVRLMPTFRDKKRIVELTRAIEKSISDYLFTTSVINFALGLVIGVGMWAIGMPNPILWGVMAMFLNYFPFVGAIIGATIVFLAAIVSFESIAYSSWAPAIYLTANLIEANFITPVLLGRSVSLHPVWLMIFFVIVAWVWGLGGAIIAVPALAVIKICCDHIEPLMPVGEFLGR